MYSDKSSLTCLTFVLYQAGGKGRGRPKKVAESEEEASAEEAENGDEADEAAGESEGGSE